MDASDVSNLIHRDLIDYKYGFSFSLGTVKFEVGSDFPEIITEIQHYLPEVLEYNFEIHKQITFQLDSSLESKIRQICFEHGKQVKNKLDFTYKSYALEDETVLYSSDIGFEGHDHAIIVSNSRYIVVGSKLTVQILRIPIRIVREIMLRVLENIGGCFTHGAAVSFDEGRKGAVIIGNNGSGKSTTMWNLVQQKDVWYISNDRCILYLDDLSMYVYGWPLAIRLGMGTLHNSLITENLKKRKYCRPQEQDLWTQEFKDDKDAIRNWANRSKLEITPLEAKGIFGIQSRASSRIDTLLLPELKIGSGELQFIRANEEQINKVIQPNLREPQDMDYLRGFLGLRQVDDTYLIKASKKIVNKFHNLSAWRIVGDPKYFSEGTEQLLNLIKRGVKS
ncbi:hypothetical protein [Bacillus gobiensis]|uniref:hypothetical protein n=1 Tax=Bacillus gobiensis TaxID=1441095 RepID=UPI003D1FEA76